MQRDTDEIKLFAGLVCSPEPFKSGAQLPDYLPTYIVPAVCLMYLFTTYIYLHVDGRVTG